MHDVPFQLAVLCKLVKTMDVYTWVDQDRIWDVQLLHRLLALAGEGHTAREGGKSTITHCAAEYLGVVLPQDVKDSSKRMVRTSFGQWLNRPVGDIEPAYLEYVGRAAIATWHVTDRLNQRLAPKIFGESTAWGYVSPQWLARQCELWGVQTHHIQLKGAVVLREITANGLTLDIKRRNQLTDQLQATAKELRESLKLRGYMPGLKGCGRALQAILRSIERNSHGVSFAKTRAGEIATQENLLREFEWMDPFIGYYLKFAAIDSLLSRVLLKTNSRHIHPSFEPLLVTGRTSSYGAINAQNVPRDNRVRSFFVPSRGNIFIIADYVMIEMVTLSQGVMTQFGLPSQMAEAINSKKDLHKLVAASITGKEIDEVTQEDRSKAKAVNYGMPGGMGKDGLRKYAKSSYGIELTDDDLSSLTASWFNSFPEMQRFLLKESLGLNLAIFLGLSSQTLRQHRGEGYHSDAGTGQPDEKLGWMARKTMLEAVPKKNGSGEDYARELIEYFWTRLEGISERLSERSKVAVRQRQPSKELEREVSQLASLQGCFTLTGRLRAGASYCARHNTIFQGLAADGAKLALWRLWRAGFRIVNFIHDEILVEVPEGSDLTHQAESIRRHMIDGMREVVPDVLVDVKYSASRRWYKDAVKVLDADGRLIPWEPTSTSIGD